MFGEPQKGTTLPGQLMKGHSMMLEIRYKKRQLVAEPKEGTYRRLIRWVGKLESAEILAGSGW